MNKYKQIIFSLKKLVQDDPPLTFVTSRSSIKRQIWRNIPSDPSEWSISDILFVGATMAIFAYLLFGR